MLLQSLKIQTKQTSVRCLHSAPYGFFPFNFGGVVVVIYNNGAGMQIYVLAMNALHTFSLTAPHSTHTGNCANVWMGRECAVIITHICHTFTRLCSVSKRKIKLLPSKWWFSRDTRMNFFIHFLLSYFGFLLSRIYCCCGCGSVAMKSIHAEESFPFPNCLKCARKRHIVCQRLCMPKNKSYSLSTREKINAEHSTALQLRNYESHYCNNDSFY